MVSSGSVNVEVRTKKTYLNRSVLEEKARQHNEEQDRKRERDDPVLRAEAERREKEKHDTEQREREQQMAEFLRRQEEEQVALANAQKFGFDTVGCSSTGNLANSVAAQAARLGLKACILIPADLEPAKILNTLVYGARLIRIDGNYAHVNRLSTLIADEYRWGFVNVNLRPYDAEGSKTVG